MNRILSALAFPAVILALVCLWQARQTDSQLSATLYLATAAALVFAAIAGIRQRHGKR
jgi:hypothetical protein